MSLLLKAFYVALSMMSCDVGHLLINLNRNCLDGDIDSTLKTS